MSKRKKNPLPGRGAPAEYYQPYSWTKSWARGGSQMRKTSRASAIFQLVVLGVGLIALIVTLISELFQ